MNRRQLLSLQNFGNNDTDVADPPRIMSGLTPYTGAWTTAEAKHLLRRTMFGATKADADYFASLTMSQAITELLTMPVAPSPPLYTFSDDVNVPFGTTWVNAAYDNATNGNRLRSYRSWWYGQMLNSGRNIREKMVYFWHNHFSTEIQVVKEARYCYKYNDLLRQNALGNFKVLTKSVTLDPAMLTYLNGYLNTKNAPDENYGRELQELFTVGKDENGVPYYTESDVQAAAKVLTGYRINGVTATSYFDATKHDTSSKIFSSYYGNTVITGTGQSELDALLDMIFATPQPALTLCRKLYRFFTYYTVDAQTETDVIQPLATIFRNNNYDIAPVLQAFLSSEHFYDLLNRGALIKTPLDFAVGLCRDFSVQFPTSANLLDQYNLWYKMYTQVITMNQAIGDPPNVAGWPAYYQEPQYHELWINATTLPARNVFSDTMCYTGYKSGTSTIVVDVVGYTDMITQALPDPNDPNMLIQELIDRHYSEDVSQTVKDYMKGYLLSGQVNDSYWSSAWIAYTSDKTNVPNYNIVATRLRSLFKYLMDLSEYQLS